MKRITNKSCWDLDQLPNISEISIDGFTVYPNYTYFLFVIGIIKRYK